MSSIEGFWIWKSQSCCPIFQSLERSMKFSFEDPHLWKQHALSLLSIGHYQHSLAVLREVIRLEPNNSSNCLLAAKLCYEHINLAEEGELNNTTRCTCIFMIDCWFEGIDFSVQARERELNNPSGLLGRCHLYAGIGYYLRAEASLLKKEQDYLRCKAIDNIRR